MFKTVQKEELKVPAQVEHLGDLRDFVVSIGKKHHLTDKMVNAFKLAVDEAATNIIKHAYENSQSSIAIKATVKKDSVTMILIDQGIYYDPSWSQDPDIRQAADGGDKAGLGIFMMRRLMDRIDYEKTDAGNELHLIKFRRDAKTAEIKGSKRLADVPPFRDRYFIYAVLSLTLVIAGIYGFTYFEVDEKITADFIDSGKQETQKLLEKLDTELLRESETVANSHIRSIAGMVMADRLGQIYSVAIEDTLGFVAWSSLGAEIDTKYQLPDSVKILEPGLATYFTIDSTEVLEFERDLDATEPMAYAKLRVLLSLDYAKRQIELRRWYYLKVAMIVLVLGYIVSGLLSYLITDPMRKLSSWVRAVHQGEVDNEVNIDTSSEFGEIAQAFTELNAKFRESQRSLAHQETFKKEIELAKDIQQALLPNKLPTISHYEIAACYEAAKSVGGDYYDFFEVDKDTLGVVVADVSGKGVPGSLVMTMIRTALRTEARSSYNSAEVLTRVNDFIINDIKHGMFVTVLYLIIDTKRHEVNFASAGHTPMILHRKATEQTFYLNPLGFPIGIRLPDDNLFGEYIQAETIQLQPEDILILYTDGITEAMNARRELFGEERLLDFVRANCSLGINKFRDKLKTRIKSFTEGYPQNDDITFLAIRGQQQAGIEWPEPQELLSVEHNFLNIHEVTRLLDVVRRLPNLEPQEMADELNAGLNEAYWVPVEKIESELVRRKLNTILLRQEYSDICKARRRNQNLPGQPDVKLANNKQEELPPKIRSQAETESSNIVTSDFIMPDSEADYIVGDFLLEGLDDSSGEILVDEAADEFVTEEFVSLALQDDLGLNEISDSLIDTLLESHLGQGEEDEDEDLLSDESEDDVDAGITLQADKGFPHADADEATWVLGNELGTERREPDTDDLDSEVMPAGTSVKTDEVEADAKEASPEGKQVKVIDGEDDEETSSEVDERSPEAESPHQIERPAEGEVDEAPPDEGRTGTTEDLPEIKEESLPEVREKEEVAPQDSDGARISETIIDAPVADEIESTEATVARDTVEEPTAGKDEKNDARTDDGELTDVASGDEGKATAEKFELVETADLEKPAKEETPAELAEVDKIADTSNEDVLDKHVHDDSPKEPMEHPGSSTTNTEEKELAEVVGEYDEDERADLEGEAIESTFEEIVVVEDVEDFGDIECIDETQAVEDKTEAPHSMESEPESDEEDAEATRELSSDPEEISAITNENISDESSEEPVDSADETPAIEEQGPAELIEVPVNGFDGEPTASAFADIVIVREIDDFGDIERIDESSIAEEETEVRDLAESDPESAEETGVETTSESSLEPGEITSIANESPEDGPISEESPDELITSIEATTDAEMGEWADTISEEDHDSFEESDAASKEIEIAQNAEDFEGIEDPLTGEAPENLKATEPEPESPVEAHNEPRLESSTERNGIPVGANEDLVDEAVSEETSDEPMTSIETTVDAEREAPVESIWEDGEDFEDELEVQPDPTSKQIETAQQVEDFEDIETLLSGEESENLKATEPESESPVEADREPMLESSAELDESSGMADEDLEDEPAPEQFPGEPDVTTKATPPTEEEVTFDVTEEYGEAGVDENRKESITSNFEEIEDSEDFDEFETFDEVLESTLSEHSDFEEMAWDTPAEDDETAVSDGFEEVFDSTTNQAQDRDKPPEETEESFLDKRIHGLIQIEHELPDHETPISDLQLCEFDFSHIFFDSIALQEDREDTAAEEELEGAEQDEIEDKAEELEQDIDQVNDHLAEYSINSYISSEFEEDDDFDDITTTSEFPPLSFEEIERIRQNDEAGITPSESETPSEDILDEFLAKITAEPRDAVEPGEEAQEETEAASKLQSIDEYQAEAEPEPETREWSVQSRTEETPEAEAPSQQEPKREERPADHLPEFEVALLQGITHYKKREYVEAIKEFKRLLMLEPDYKDGYQLLGNAYFRHGMLKDALAAYERHKLRYPSDGMVRENLGLIYAKLGVLPLAIKEWQALLETNPGRKDIARKIERLEVYLEDSKKNKQRTRETQSDSEAVQKTNGNGHVEEEFVEERRVDPIEEDLNNYKNELLQVGIKHYRRQEYERAIEAFEFAIKSFPDLQQAYPMLANTYYRTQRFDDAARIYMKMTTMDFDRTAIHENMGMIYAHQGDYKKALDEWKRALKYNPNRRDIQKRVEKVSEML